MDEFGNWIYIIIMVIVAITSLLSSMNKKKGQQQTQMPDPEFPEEWFPTPPVPPVPKKMNRKTPPPIPVHSKNKPYHSIPMSQILNTELLEPEKETLLIDELDLSDAEAFRKAIIYSEILNRKYI